MLCAWAFSSSWAPGPAVTDSGPATERPEADPMRRPDHGDGRQHRPGARHEQQPEAQSEYDAVAVRVDLAAADPDERPFQQLTEPVPDQSDTDQHEDDDPGVTEQVLRQVQGAEHERTEQRGQAETHNQPEDHAVGPPGPGAPVCPGRARGQHDRQHREDARGDARDHAGQKPDDDQRDHGRLPP